MTLLIFVVVLFGLILIGMPIAFSLISDFSIFNVLLKCL